jgi:signal transduction protein with GAF and PtsI domain
MTDAELIVAIRKILRTRPRLKGVSAKSVEAADLARYDQIVGLVARHPEPVKAAKAQTIPHVLGETR